MKKTNIQFIGSLSPMQEGILANYIFDLNKNNYVEQFSYDVEGDFEPELYCKVINILVKKHMVLRTNFIYKKLLRPVQVVFKEKEINIQIHDISNKTHGHENYLYNCQKKELSKRFNLTKDSLLRIVIIKRDENKYSVIWTFHHLILDIWSLQTLLKECRSLYENGIDREDCFSEALPFSRYIEWIDKKDMLAANHWWQKYLLGYKGEVFWEQQTKDSTINTKEIFKFSLNKEKTNQIINVASLNKTTSYVIIETLFALVLHSLFLSKDMILGIVKNGRDCGLKGIDKAIGLYINTTLKRFIWDKELKFNDVISLSINENKDINNFNYFPLYQIDTKPNIRKELLYYIPIIVYNNESFEETIYNSLITEDRRYNVSGISSYEETNYVFHTSIHANKDGGIEFIIKYNNAIFTREYIQLIETKINESIPLIEKNMTIGEVLGSFTQRDMKPETCNNSIGIFASFTIEPIKNVLNFWLKKHQLNMNMEYLAYNYIFEKMTDYNFWKLKKYDLAIFFIRFEDLMIENNNQESYLIDKLKDICNEYQKMLISISEIIPIFVGILPIDEKRFSDNVYALLIQLYDQLKECLKQSSNIKIVDFNYHQNQYLYEKIYLDNYEHRRLIPFSNSYYSIIGTVVARYICAWSGLKHKVIVLDCDNTLWKGVCSEEKVEITENYMFFQNFLLHKKKEGFLLALCSKNVPEDITRVFRENPNMPLKESDFIIKKINWDNKSKNICDIANELNLGLDSIIFFDDNNLECTEVLDYIPEVLTYMIPKDDKLIPNFLYHIWALDVFRISDEDQCKTELYIQENERKKIRDNEKVFQDYLVKLNMKVYISDLSDKEEIRVVQLFNKTNQFNLSSEKITVSFIKSYILSGGHCWVIEAEDFFGKYGLIGSVILKRTGIDGLLVEKMAISCRALGRRIEDILLMVLKTYCIENGITFIEVAYKQTNRNKQIKDFLRRFNLKCASKVNNIEYYKIHVGDIKTCDIDFATLIYDKMPNETKKVNNEANTDSVVFSCEDNSTMSIVEEYATFFSSLQYLSGENERYYLPILNTHIDDLYRNSYIKETNIIRENSLKYERDIIEILSQIMDISKETIEQLNGDTNLSDELPFDSLVAIRLIVGLEERFKFEINDDELFLDNLNNLNAINLLIERTLNSAL
jgi:FkbH-like protein